MPALAYGRNLHASALRKPEISRRWACFPDEAGDGDSGHRAKNDIPLLGFENRIYPVWLLARWIYPRAGMGYEDSLDISKMGGISGDAGDKSPG